MTPNISDDVMEVNNYPSNNISTDRKEGMTEVEKENNPISGKGDQKFFKKVILRG